MKIILLLLIICSSHLGFSQKLAENDSTIRTSKTIIELEDAKTIFKEKKNDWWDKYSSGLIAGITVLVSLGISIWQAYNSHKHTKANIISEARIEWIQKLRPYMGELISKISIFSDIFKEFEDDYIDPKTKKRRTNLTDEEEQKLDDGIKELTLHIYRITETFNQVKLFLNRKESEHINFINSVDNFTNNFMEVVNIDDFENNLILEAQIILKNAWTQAKFGDKKAQKIIKKEKELLEKESKS